VPKDSADNLQAKRDALDAWSKLPQGKPSREALPPAGGGLGYFFGWFIGALGKIRQHWLLSLAIVASILTVCVLLFW